MEKILVTGAAGFIGFHVAQTLLSRGYEVVGLDNLNDYYDVNLKTSRLQILCSNERFRFYKLDLADDKEILNLFEKEMPSYVINLAAQAGVRYSLTHPFAYVQSNITGFLSILEACRRFPVRHLVYASSSSVYGCNTKLPFSPEDTVDHPISLYAASKKSNELMAHTYSHLFRIPCSGLRFFTVYGPWGRPDMAMFIFAKAITEGRPIDVFNHGNMKRDFTYIDDIVQGVIKVLFHIPSGNAKNFSTVNATAAPCQIYNIGNHRSVELMYVIQLIENELGRKALMNLLPIQQGDVPETFADIDSIKEAVGFEPTTPIEVGVRRFIEWYKGHYVGNRKSSQHLAIELSKNAEQI